MRHEAASVRAVDVAQGAILLDRVVHGDPRRDDVVAGADAEVPVILMIRFRAADIRRFDEDLVRVHERPSPAEELGGERRHARARALFGGRARSGSR